MDISTITDIDKLKSMGYDQVMIIEQAQKNLQAVNQRIAELQAQSEPEK